MELVSGESLSIQEKVDDMHRCYAKSCEHNGTTQDDMKYFRDYVFFCMVLQAETMNKIIAKIEK